MISFITALLLSAPVATVTTDNVVTVSLPLEASILGSEMTLGEIAEVQGDDANDVESVEAFTLGYSPAPGYSRVIQRWRVEQQLTKEFPRLQINFEGKAACRVWPRTAEINASELERVAREAISSSLLGEDTEVTLHTRLENEKVPAGRISRRLVADAASGTLKSGVLNVPIKILIDDTKYRTVWVSFDVTLYRELPVLRRAVPQGGLIKPDDLVMRRVAVDASFAKEALSPAMLVGASARRPLDMGSPIAARDIQRQLAVKAGETVALEIVNGRVVVNTKVMAMMDGFVGDVVGIRTLETGKELTAVVIKSGRLQLRLGATENNEDQ